MREYFNSMYPITVWIWVRSFSMRMFLSPLQMTSSMYILLHLLKHNVHQVKFVSITWMVSWPWTYFTNRIYFSVIFPCVCTIWIREISVDTLRKPANSTESTSQHLEVKLSPLTDVLNTDLSVFGGKFCKHMQWLILSPKTLLDICCTQNR